MHIYLKYQQKDSVMKHVCNSYILHVITYI